MLNNRNNRASAVQVGLPYRMALPFPAGVINRTQRQFLGSAYAGIVVTATPFVARDERLSTLQLTLPYRMVLPFPSGTIAAPQRQCLGAAISMIPTPPPITPPLGPLVNYKATVDG
jgi:hypothetical protein